MSDPSPTGRPVRREFLLEDPAWAARRARRRRVLLRSVVVIVVVIAFGSTVALFLRARARRSAVREVVAADLERLAVAQGQFLGETGRFARLEDLGASYVASQGVWVWVDRADSAGWEARGSHLRVDVVCRVVGDRDGVDPPLCN